MVKTKKGKKSSRRRYPLKAGRKLFHYGTVLLVLTLLVAAAFFTPQIIFGVQDRILCGDTVLSQRESMNVGMLSATYEKSMAARMTNFAEGLAEEENFYLSSQELEITYEIDNYLYGERGLYQQMIDSFREVRWLAADMWTYKVTSWKQYVIYSDNYTKGVNFILWYIEMENEYGERMKLLADAEDGTMYAIRSENNTRMWEYPDIAYADMDYWNDYAASELWCYFMLYYDGMTQKDVEIISRLVNETTMNSVNGVLEYFRHVYHPEEPYEEDMPYRTYAEILNRISYEIELDSAEGYETDISTDGDGTETQVISVLGNGDIVVGENAGYHIRKNGEVIYYLPYGNGHLEVIMETKDVEYHEKLWEAGIYMYPDITIGIREIYEMIPEFA